jgi:hypothetical protein
MSRRQRKLPQAADKYTGNRKTKGSQTPQIKKGIYVRSDIQTTGSLRIATKSGNAYNPGLHL